MAEIRKPEQDRESVSPDPNTDPTLPPLVTVFGAGIAGLTVAHELAERGFHVQVIEKTESQFEEYECEVGGMAANQFSRVPAPVKEVTPDLNRSDARDVARRLRQVRMAEDLQRAQQRFPIKHRIRFDKERRAPDQAAVGGASSQPPDWRDCSDDYGVINEKKMQDVLRIIQEAHALYSREYNDRESKWSQSESEDVYTNHLKAIDMESAPSNRNREILLVKVVGYTDSDGDPKSNRELSKRWAEKVTKELKDLNNKQRKDYQIQRIEDHLEAEGGGSSRPIGDQRNPFDRARSNRVEFQIVEQLLPGEHGFRFFPNFYRHLFDTMRRTPILDDAGDVTGRSAFDQLVPTPDAFLALEDGRPPFRVRARRFRTLVQVREALETFMGRLGFTTRDMTNFHVKLQRYMTSSKARRKKETEDHNFVDYFGGDTAFSEAALKFIDSTPRALAAMSARETDARTQCNILIQLMGQDPLRPHVDDMTLNGPTTDAWMRHWKRYLKQQGVRFFVGSLDGLDFIEGERELIPRVNGPLDETVPRPEESRHRLRGRILDAGGDFVDIDGPRRSNGSGHGESDYAQQYPLKSGRQRRSPWKFGRQFYVLALPFEATSKLIWDADQRRRAMQEKNPAARVPFTGPFRQVIEYDRFCKRCSPGEEQIERRRDPASGQPSPGDPLRDISGIQFFFPNNYRLGAGHVYWVDSPWALTSISQFAFWRDRVKPVGDYIGQISIDLGDWYTPYPRDVSGDEGDPGHTAWHSTASEIAGYCWDQVKAGVSAERETTIAPPRFYHLDSGIRFYDEKDIGYHGNLALKITPEPLRENRRRELDPYRLHLERFDSDQTTTDHNVVIGANGEVQLDDVAEVANALTRKINGLDQGNFAFAVHEAADILISPVVTSNQIVIYFRGDSSDSYHIKINEVEITIPPRNQNLNLSVDNNYYVDDLIDQLERDGKLGNLEIQRGGNYVLVAAKDSSPEFTCAVVNRDDMIEIVDGPRLEVKSRYRNIQIVKSPGRASGILRKAAFRANALLEVPTNGGKQVTGSAQGQLEPPIPETGRLYRLDVSVASREEGTTKHTVPPPATDRPAPKETAETLIEKLHAGIMEKAQGSFHSKVVHRKVDGEPRVGILISPIAKADDMSVKVLGVSQHPFEVMVNDQICSVNGDYTSPEEIRNALLDKLKRQLGKLPDHSNVAVRPVGQRSIRLHRTKSTGKSGDPVPPFAVAAWNIDAKIELVGAPVVEICTKDLPISLDRQDPVVLRNQTPFQINPPKHWPHRPGHSTRKQGRRVSQPSFPRDRLLDSDEFEYGHPDSPALQRWVMAGTHMATYTRMTTMEAANESGRHAVNAILNRMLEQAGEQEATEPLYGSPSPWARHLLGDYCQTWDLEDEELEDLRFFKELDDALGAENLPHVHDILGLSEAMETLPEFGQVAMGPKSEERLKDLTRLLAVGSLPGPHLLTQSTKHYLQLLLESLRIGLREDDKRK